MKKLMFAAVACAALSGFCVESQIVGYNTQSIPKNQFAMVGVQFTSVGSTGDEVAISDFIKGDFEAYDYSFPPEYDGAAPCIQVWTGGGYDKYFYLKEHHIMNIPDLPLVPEGWCNADGEAAGTITLDAGRGVWFICPGSACTITTPGAVAVAEDSTFTCTKDQFAMLANFIPVSLDITDSKQIEFAGFPAYDYSFPPAYDGFAPNIQVWTGGGYDKYFYLKEHHIMNIPDLPLVPEGWCNADGEALTEANKIPVGRGFWIIVRNSTENTYTVKFKQ